MILTMIYHWNYDNIEFQLQWKHLNWVLWLINTWNFCNHQSLSIMIYHYQPLSSHYYSLSIINHDSSWSIITQHSSIYGTDCNGSMFDHCTIIHPGFFDHSAIMITLVLGSIIQCIPFIINTISSTCCCRYSLDHQFWFFANSKIWWFVGHHQCSQG